MRLLTASPGRLKVPAGTIGETAMVHRYKRTLACGLRSVATTAIVAGFFTGPAMAASVPLSQGCESLKAAIQRFSDLPRSLLAILKTLIFS